MYTHSNNGAAKLLAIHVHTEFSRRGKYILQLKKPFSTFVSIRTTDDLHLIYKSP